jgi:hypothetical protein
LQIYEPTLGIEEERPSATFSHLTIGPNPARDELFLQVPSAAGSSTLRLYDCAGKLVRQVSMSSRTACVPVRELAPGIYVARLGVLSRKFIVAH